MPEEQGIPWSAQPQPGAPTPPPDWQGGSPGGPAGSPPPDWQGGGGLGPAGSPPPDWQGGGPGGSPAPYWQGGPGQQAGSAPGQYGYPPSGQAPPAPPGGQPGYPAGGYGGVPGYPAFPASPTRTGRRRRVVIGLCSGAAALVVVIALAASNGGMSMSEWGHKASPVITRLGSDMSTLGEDASSQHYAAIPGETHKLQRDVKAADELPQPPQKIRGEWTRLLRDLQSDTTKLAAATKAQSLTQLAQALESFANVATDFNQLSQTIRANE